MLRTFFVFFVTAFAMSIHGQTDDKKVTVSGSIQSDILIPQDDEKINAEHIPEDLLTNSYAEVNVMSKYVDAGLRLEYLEHPLPGFENDFKGWGVPYFYVKGKLKDTELTLGHFYEQFGSGFVLRTYEERSLGIDNSLLGVRLVSNPLKGVRVKALTGKQRRYWHTNHAWVSGADVELSLDQWFHPLESHGIYLTLGASFVNKHEKASDDEIFVDATHKLNLPENVNAWDVRLNLTKGPVSILAEYAGKSQDPSFDNGYVYRHGHAAMLSMTYAKSGLSLLAQAKRSVNMSFRSRRSMTGLSSTISCLPPFTMEHTYALPALYPYATHPDGEWAYQLEAGYSFKRNTFLGGRYGTSVKMNFSHVHAIDRHDHDGESSNGLMGTNGYGSSFWKWGDQTYYQDFNIQVEKRLTSDFKMNLLYMNQMYNMTVVEGEGGMVHSNIFVAEGQYKFNKHLSLRGELQYLTTHDDNGDWMFGLMELSFAPHWMFTLSDEWNCGETDLHYYMGSVTFNTGSHRIQAGYGRTREGFNCSGGVCRYVPATKGFTLSYNYNF